jgi:hypothetical protein
MRLLEWLHIPEPDGQKLALVLAMCLISGMLWLTWQVRRDLIMRPRDPVARAYDTFCKRLSAVGVSRLPHEGAEAFAARVAAQRPDLAGAVTRLCRNYSDLRYADADQSGAPPGDNPHRREPHSRNVGNQQEAHPYRIDDARTLRRLPAAAVQPSSAAAFIADVRAFRPRGSRGSS